MKGPVFGDWTFLVNRVAPFQKGPVTEDWTFLSSKHPQSELQRSIDLSHFRGRQPPPSPTA